jgi:hypothetical protein
MQKLIIMIATLSLLGGTAVAQITSNGSGAPPSVAPNQRAGGTAPVGHRQPRPTPALTAEENAAKLDAQEAALDRKIKSICRGC